MASPIRIRPCGSFAGPRFAVCLCAGAFAQLAIATGRFAHLRSGWGTLRQEPIPSCLENLSSAEDAALVQQNFSDPKGTREVFERIYRERGWGENDGTLSGVGSVPRSTVTACAVLSEAVARRLDAGDGNVIILDAPVGDFFWQPLCLQKVARRLPDGAFIDYYGMDVSETALTRAAARSATFQPEMTNVRLHEFSRIDLVNGQKLREVFAAAQPDIILSNDALMHNTQEHIWKILSNFDELRSTYLVVNSYVDGADNRDIATGDYRRLDLTSRPFDLRPICGDLEKIWDGNRQDEGEYILLYACPVLGGNAAIAP